MTLHLIKLCVGVDDVGQLAAFQAARLARQRSAGQVPALCHMTRHMPRRADALLDGGALYWVIRGWVRVRQRLTTIEILSTEEGPRCALGLDTRLVRTSPRAHRPFQGWRYLKADDAPPDLETTAAAMPDTMVAELKELGLL